SPRRGVCVPPRALPSGGRSRRWCLRAWQELRKGEGRQAGDPIPSALSSTDRPLRWGSVLPKEYGTPMSIKQLAALALAFAFFGCEGPKSDGRKHSERNG